MRKYFPVLVMPKDWAIEWLRFIWHSFIPMVFGVGALFMWQLERPSLSVVLVCLACIPHLLPVIPEYLYERK